MQYIDIPSAVSLSGTSESSVRRWLRGLSEADREKYVRKEGKRVTVEKSFLLRSFQVHDFSRQAEVQEDSTLASFALRQLAEKDRQIRHLEAQTDSLLSDLREKDNSLKAAWGKITALTDENKLLASQVKSLSAGGSQSADRLSVIAFILFVLVAAVALWLIAA
jgi:hypothetical protein